MMKVLLVLLAVTMICFGGDWSNSGGNSGRNGLSSEVGPLNSNLLWSGGRTSLIAWQPVTEGTRVFMIRQLGWAETPDDSPVVCMDIETGEELWAVNIPYETGDWTTWIAGVNDGLVFVSRSGNGASVSAKLYALSLDDGTVVWESTAEITAGPYDGVVFAADGDPIVASFQNIWRFDSEDGSVVWESSRTASVSGTCGGCLYGYAFYVVDVAVNGHVLVRYDAETGVEMYQGPLMQGFTAQCTPMVSPDGIIYFNRSQNNPVTDFFYAFEDDGASITEKWHTPTVNAAGPEFGIGSDGSVLFVIPGPRLARINPADGSIIDQTDVLPNYSKSRIAVSSDGTVFFSNGEFATGRLYAFTEDLSLLWEVPVTNINIGGPALGQGGTLVVCGNGTIVRAYRDDNGIDAGNDPYPSGPIMAVTPNPSSGPVIIYLSGGMFTEALVTVFDLSGRTIAVLQEGTSTVGGAMFQWDGCDQSGADVPAGAYLVKAVSGSSTVEGMMVRLR